MSPHLEPTLAAPVAARGAVDRMIGQRLGPYRLVEEIGQGGMGTVYRAVRDDGEFQIEVAIKVVRGGVSSQMLLARFRTERQILARLEHPNIGRLLDGGTTDDGLTYFLMEYIKGEPLTHYCDDRKLSVSQRLELFRKVCDGVSYAHQNLIVHRDLKPDNILVTADGTPKLLDFGIAKILEIPALDGNEPTMTMVRLGTPAYSSPEQVRGEPVGIATDVYSLGVVLYELLTGQRPYRLESLGWEESMRVICERDATRPSSVVSSKPDSPETQIITRSRNTTAEGLRKRLAGDLDNIVAVALRKEPARRYRSVDHFSEEIARHLEGRPVKARGDSIAYKTSKLIARHKVAAATAACFSVLLCGATGFAAWQAHRLALRLDEDRKLASSFLMDIHDGIAKLPGSTPMREALLARSVDYLNGLTRENGGDREMRRSLALAYERFTDLLAGVDGAGLGRSAQALETYQKARTMREALAREMPQDEKAKYELASNYLIGSYVSGRASSIEQRLVYDRKALEMSQALYASSPQNPDYQALLAKAYSSAAYGYGMNARWSDAAEYYRKALPIRQHLAASARQDKQAQRELANLSYRIGVIEAQSEHPSEALKDLADAERIQEQMAKTDKDDARIRSEMASTEHFLGVSSGAMGNTLESLAHFHKAISLHETLLAADASDARTKSLLAGNYAEQSAVLLRAHRKKDALASIQHALDLQRQLLILDKKGVPVRLSFADYQAKLGAVYASMGRQQEAGRVWRTSASLYDELDREGHLTASDVRRDAARARAEASRF